MTVNYNSNGYKIIRIMEIIVVLCCWGERLELKLTFAARRGACRVLEFELL